MNWIKKQRKHLRLWVQVLFTALTNGYVIGFTEGKIYRGTSKKRENRVRAFKLTIPTDAGNEYEYCFRIPEKFGNARTRNQAMGNRLEELQCAEFNSLK